MRQCLFCPETKLTREHVWPNWIVEYFELTAPPNRTRFKGSIDRHGKTVHEWDSNTITHKSRFVCSGCNNNWMSQLETLAKPIMLPLLHDSSVPFYFSNLTLRTITAWLQLRSMVFDSLGADKRLRFYSYSDRRAFAVSDTMEPPLSSRLWLASYLGEEHAARFTVYNYVSVGDDYGLHIATSVINQIAFQLVTWKGHKRRFRDAAMDRDGWNTATRQVWPIPRRRNFVAWPPKAYLTASSFETFRDRFKLPGFHDSSPA